MVALNRRWIVTVILLAASSFVNTDSTCGEDEISCGSGTCIQQAQQCDGEVDCPDGSDEQFHRCWKSERPMFALALHCSNRYTRDLFPVVLCHPLCSRHTDLPELCFYAMMTMYLKEAPEGPENTCWLPKWPANGTYSVLSIERYSFMTLHFTCHKGFDLEGDERVRCKGGAWMEELPTCKELLWGVPEDDLRK